MAGFSHSPLTIFRDPCHPDNCTSIEFTGNSVFGVRRRDRELWRAVVRGHQHAVRAPRDSAQPVIAPVLFARRQPCSYFKKFKHGNSPYNHDSITLFAIISSHDKFLYVLCVYSSPSNSAALAPHLVQSYKAGISSVPDLKRHHSCPWFFNSFLTSASPWQPATLYMKPYDTFRSNFCLCLANIYRKWQRIEPDQMHFGRFEPRTQWPFWVSYVH